MIEQLASGLERYLTLLSIRQKLAASNIANVDTPGYRTRDIDFRAELERIHQERPPEIQEVSGLYLKNDGNNVSVDRESRLLAENALQFSVAASLIREQLKQVRMAITEGASQ
jgi:flagellar basal-body rod protein FlgB